MLTVTVTVRYLYSASYTSRPTAHHKTKQHVPWCPDTDSNKNNVLIFLRNESVDRSSFRSVGSLFHARGAATEKALSLIRRHVRGMTSLSQDEARSADRAGMSATGVTASPRCTPACVQEVTSDLASTSFAIM